MTTTTPSATNRLTLRRQSLRELTNDHRQSAPGRGASYGSWSISYTSA
ncbi:hypothetical protein SMNI109538_18185 [Smaragdicoccus niigatensis]